MLDPDRAIAFTHESDGQPPRGAGLRPGPLYGGRTFTGGVEIQKHDLKIILKFFSALRQLRFHPTSH
jgi:hypothetical protein